MFDLEFLFAIQQCEHYAQAIYMAQSAINIELAQIACEVTSIDAWGAALEIRDCVHSNGGPMVCDFEFGGR